jgi:DNA (cytosine-5)-methyltransferase 1
MREIIVDSFAGGGGASLGIELATGRSPDIAINHDAEAIALHRANHPRSRHYQEDVWRVDPVEACVGRRVGLMWLSPDCTHHSKARGGKPRKKKVRGLAWVAVRWAAAVQPRVIVLENVEEFQTWGPLLPNGLPCPARKGKTFRAFVSKLRRLGYAVEWRELRGCDYGAPTIRKRLFLIARRDGQPIAWPAPTHDRRGRGGLSPWRAAAECIDWALPCPSIFLSREEGRAIGVRRPLAANTLRRIARGLFRYVIDTPRPFIVPVSHAGDNRVHLIDEPLRTITGSSRSTHALVAPTLINTRNGEREGQAPRVRDIADPYPTITAEGSQGALVAAFLAKHQSERRANEVQAASLFDPAPTVKAHDSNALVAAHVMKMRGENVGHSADEPLHTVSAGGFHFAEVRAFLLKFYGTDQDPRLDFPLHTVTSRDRFGLVTVQGQDYAIVDIGMRMLSSRELYRAQGFPDSYRIEIDHNGKPLSKTAQVRMVGNSVCPPLAAAIVRANYGERRTVEVAA